MLTATTTLGPGTWPDPDRVFAALADATRRDIVWRAITGAEGVVELSAHYPMSFAAVQKHIAVLERAGLVTKERVGRRKVVRSNVEAIRMAQRMLDRYEQLWRDRIDRMASLLEEPMDAGSQQAAIDQPLRETLAREGRSAEVILGHTDAMKLRSSMTAFLRAAPDEPLFGRVLERFYGGIPDARTDDKLHEQLRDRLPPVLKPRVPL